MTLYNLISQCASAKLHTYLLCLQLCSYHMPGDTIFFSHLTVKTFYKDIYLSDL